jgi:SAM-dependent methyltransferase
MFGTKDNGVHDPLRYDGHLDAPQEVARMLADLVPVGSRVLDVGCGTGSVSRIIADTRNAKIIGIESNSHRAADRTVELRNTQNGFLKEYVENLGDDPWTGALSLIEDALREKNAPSNRPTTFCRLNSKEDQGFHAF